MSNEYEKFVQLSRYARWIEMSDNSARQIEEKNSIPAGGNGSTNVMFSSLSAEWETPQQIFDALHEEFDFTHDLAANHDNTKCKNYFTTGDAALVQDWAAVGRRGWLNPPYSRGLCKQFIQKAAEERLRGFLTVALLPARTDTKMFHQYIYDKDIWQPREGIDIRLLAGRLKFSGSENSAPFPSMVVVFKPQRTFEDYQF